MGLFFGILSFSAIDSTFMHLCCNGNWSLSYDEGIVGSVLNV